MHIHYMPKCDTIQELLDMSTMPTVMKVVLLDCMELKVYVFSDGIHEQFLADILKSVSLINKQLHHLDKHTKADTVLNDAIQEHDSKKKELDNLTKESTKKQRTPTTEEKSKIKALIQEVKKLDKMSMELLTIREKIASKPLALYGNQLGEEEGQIWEQMIIHQMES